MDICIYFWLVISYEKNRCMEVHAWRVVQSARGREWVGVGRLSSSICNKRYTATKAWPLDGTRRCKSSLASISRSTMQPGGNSGGLPATKSLRSSQGNWISYYDYCIK